MTVLRSSAPAVPAAAARRLFTVLLAALLVTGLGVVAAPAVDAATANPVREVQQRLHDLGYPVGAIDGIDGPRTRQGLCTWRRLEGRTASRQPLAKGELDAIRATTRLPKATTGRGVQVDKTCQTLAYRDQGRWQKVLITSTGTGGLPKNGSFKVQRVRAGWHTSTLYPSATPNMYAPMYFDGAIAIHGSTSVPARPASKGCARVTPKAADWLYSRLKVGDPVVVVGAWS